MLGAALAVPSFSCVAFGAPAESGAAETAEGAAAAAGAAVEDGIEAAAAAGISAETGAEAAAAAGTEVAPRTKAAAGIAVATETGAPLEPSAARAQDAGVVSVAADVLSAQIDGCAFAVHDFYRAQKGSNKEIQGAYQGYNYLVGADANYVCALATPAFVLVHVPESVSGELGLDVESAQVQQSLKAYIMALDQANAGGYAAVAEDVPWYFTQETAVEMDGVLYRFGAQLQEGSFYTSVIGAAGEDVTQNASFAGSVPTHADAFRISPAEAVAVKAPATGLAAFAEFLQGIDMSPLWVTLKTTGVAIVLVFFLGLAAAWWSLRMPRRLQDAADTVFTIPMVLPPTVCGFILLMCLGNNSPVGRWFIDVGFPLIFSWPATVIAATVVAFPLMYRSARGAFEGLDPNMLDAARTLGWSEGKIFFRLMLPLSWSSIAAGTVLAYARALGEFGATLFLAGNYVGITRTIPLAIYFEWMAGNTDAAIFWTAVVLMFSFAVILFVNVWSRRATKYRQRGER